MRLEKSGHDTPTEDVQASCSSRNVLERKLRLQGGLMTEHDKSGHTLRRSATDFHVLPAIDRPAPDEATSTLPTDC